TFLYLYFKFNKINICTIQYTFIKQHRMIVEEGAKTAPTSTIFIYIFGSKASGSSLTSQIAAKGAANCDARLKNILLLI
ncbi:MAG: hypothetical protein ACRCX2_03235, partial [Paraclostridium sp.]